MFACVPCSQVNEHTVFSALKQHSNIPFARVSSYTLHIGEALTQFNLVQFYRVSVEVVTYPSAPSTRARSSPRLHRVWKWCDSWWVHKHTPDTLRLVFSYGTLFSLRFAGDDISTIAHECEECVMVPARMEDILNSFRLEMTSVFYACLPSGFWVRDVCVGVSEYADSVVLWNLASPCQF